MKSLYIYINSNKYKLYRRTQNMILSGSLGPILEIGSSILRFLQDIFSLLKIFFEYFDHSHFLVQLRFEQIIIFRSVLTGHHILIKPGAQHQMILRIISYVADWADRVFHSLLEVCSNLNHPRTYRGKQIQPDQVKYLLKLDSLGFPDYHVEHEELLNESF